MLNVKIFSGIVYMSVVTCSWATDVRFPTDLHMKYPLVLCEEEKDRRVRVTAIPFIEPQILDVARELAAKLDSRQISLPKINLESVKYYGCVGHKHGIIPNYSCELDELQITNGAHAVQLDTHGRPEVISFVKPGQSPKLENIILYDDAAGFLSVIQLRYGMEPTLHVCQFPVSNGLMDTASRPIFHVEFYSDANLLLETWDADGTNRKISSVPDASEYPTDGWRPCQALRYALQVDEITKNSDLTEDERARALLFLAQLEPEVMEMQWGGGHDYDDVHEKAIAALGAIDTPEARDALFQLRDSAASGDLAADMLIRTGDPRAHVTLDASFSRDDPKSQMEACLRILREENASSPNFINSVRAASRYAVTIPVGLEPKKCNIVELEINRYGAGFDCLKFRSPPGENRNLSWAFAMPFTSQLDHFYIIPMSGTMKGFESVHYEIGPCDNAPWPWDYRRLFQRLRDGEIKPDSEYVIWISFTTNVSETVYAGINLFSNTPELETLINYPLDRGLGLQCQKLTEKDVKVRHEFGGKQPRDRRLIPSVPAHLLEQE